MGSASSEMASSDLLWALTRKTNAFLVKRNGLQLTSEPNNLMGKHCFKYSGLANEEAVGIEECPRGVTLAKKNKKNAMAPKRAVRSTDLKKDFRKDLSKAALGRWYKIWKSQQNAAAANID